MKTNPNDPAGIGIIRTSVYDCGQFRGFDSKHVPGITKLEAFTMAAMQGVCADSNCEDPELIASFAVRVAKATIAELNKGEGQP